MQPSLISKIRQIFHIKPSTYLIMSFCRLFILMAIVLMSACHNNQLDPADKKPTSGAAPSAATAKDDPRASVAEILRTCSKVEYMVYDAGITFESEGSNEVLRFLSYITNDIPGSGCPPEKYDGNAVFKNAQGEIKFQVQFNLPAVSNCNRVIFKHNNQTYDRTIDQNGIQFFGQVLNMRNQVEK